MAAEQQSLEAEKKEMAATEASAQQREPALQAMHQQAARQAQAQQMEEEKGSEASTLALPRPAVPIGAAAAAAAASPAKQNRKRQRQPEQKQSEKPSAAAANGADEDAAEAASGPAVKASRTNRSADASSAAAAASAASAAAHSSSRPRALQAPASARGLTRRRVAQAESDMEDSDDEATAEPPQAAATSSPSAPRRISRPPKQRRSHHYVQIGAETAEEAEAARHIPRPASRRFRKEDRTIVPTDFKVHYGEPPLAVIAVNGWFRINFDELYQRGSSEEHSGLFKPTDAHTEEIYSKIAQGRYTDDDELTDAMRFLYYFVDHHAELKATARTRSNIPYLNVREDVRLVDGVPYVTVMTLYQTLMQVPYLSDAEFDALTEEYRDLYAAIEVVDAAQPKRRVVVHPTVNLDWVDAVDPRLP